MSAQPTSGEAGDEALLGLLRDEIDTVAAESGESEERCRGISPGF